jgi:hypothetical protein
MHFVSGNATETAVKVQHLKVGGTAFQGIVTVNVFYLCRSLGSDIHVIFYET